MIKKGIAVLLTCLLQLQACTSLNTKHDYKYSHESLKEGNISAAIEEFPTRERSGFIPLMEKTYLSIINGTPNIEDLARYAHNIDSQVRVKISREFKTFFYLETPEGYYASEHEIIMMHLLLSWGYSMLGDHDKARVEVKKSTILLSEKWSDEGRFDDPLLRIFSAIAWSMCGEWEEAQVDFRRAAILKPSLKWAKRLGDLNKPPKNIFIVLGGSGPEPFWKAHNRNLLNKAEKKSLEEWETRTGSTNTPPYSNRKNIKKDTPSSIIAANVGFLYTGNRSRVYLVDDKGKKIAMHISPSSKYWYKRHLRRHNALHDIIENTKYMQVSAAASGEGCLTVVGGTILGIAIIATGVVIGGGLVYLGLAAESGEAASVGMGAIIVIGGYGANVINSSAKRASRVYKKRTDFSDKYRFVRFLPEYAWVGWTRQTVSFPVRLYNKSITVKPAITIMKPVNPGQKRAVISIGFYPDTK